MMPAQAPISDAQRRMLFGLARRHGYDNEDLHDLVRHLTGLESIAKAFQKPGQPHHRAAPGA